MTVKLHETFTKYEIARIIGARALQIAMDAPPLLKIDAAELKLMQYDSLKIAEKEFRAAVKEEAVSDEELAAKEQEVEKEISQDAHELGLVEGDEVEDFQDEAVSSVASGPEEQ